MKTVKKMISTVVLLTMYALTLNQGHSPCILQSLNLIKLAVLTKNVIKDLVYRVHTYTPKKIVVRFPVIILQQV